MNDRRNFLSSIFKLGVGVAVLPINKLLTAVKVKPVKWIYTGFKMGNIPRDSQCVVPIIFVRKKTQQ